MKVREKGVSVCGLNLSNGSRSCSHAVWIVVLDTSPGTHIVPVTRDRECHSYWIHPMHLILQTRKPYLLQISTSVNCSWMGASTCVLTVKDRTGAAVGRGLNFRWITRHVQVSYSINFTGQ